MGYSIPRELYRKILLSEDITNSSVKDAINSIMNINWDDDEKESVYKDWVREPVYLFINSFGGSVYDGLALVDTIKQSKTPVYTVAIGSAMSMGFWIYLAGQKRFVGENATLMYHEVSNGVWGKAEELRLELEEMQRLQKIINKEVTSTSKVTQAQLDDYISRKAEWYIPAKKAIELGLAEGYYRKGN